jgi:alpha-L-rhamnosidase
MFQKALPIFPTGKMWEKNTHIVLRAETDSLKNTVLSIAAASFYQLFVNDIFVAFGPCRAAGGYARVDEFSLEAYHREGKNEIRVEIVGYACRSLSNVMYFVPSAPVRLFTE